MMYANRIGYTDVTPYQVVRKVSDKCLDVRAMHCELDPTWTPEYIAGGFAGHCVNNNTQHWNISPDTSAHIIRIRKNKKGQWKASRYCEFELSDTPRCFYDYNF